MYTVKVLKETYQKLLSHFDKQHWWPARTPFEVVIGAILTQNTNWSNVEKAINNLKTEGLLTPEKLYRCELSHLANLIKPSGYFNIKAKRVKSFINWLFENYDGKLESLFDKEITALREELLSVRGIGHETADSIILYAAKKPSFVVDAYTYRIMFRHQLIAEDTTYDELKALFEDSLEPDTKLFNEYHALLVKVGKTYCKKKNPLCSQCPLNSLPHSV
ncbi:MAG: endonuclease III domain-containing protein [Planctomycetota bacterium]|nr:endonuclease III domain-containing protein [Planctomycetota bacterium]MDI6787945.1 endonuclease III domain-containing protein [Planctomycetota bacterium]